MNYSKEYQRLDKRIQKLEARINLIFYGLNKIGLDLEPLEDEESMGG